MYKEFESIENLEKIMPDSNEFVAERVKKLNKLYELGVNPYPYSYKDTTHTKDILDNFENIKDEQEFTLAGRVMLIRRMGNATFGNIIDEKGNIQIFLSKKILGAESYEILKLIDVGDIIGVDGTVFKTQTGEVTIRVKQFELLSKSIRTLPENIMVYKMLT